MGNRVTRDAFILCCALATGAGAQPYPAKPVRVVVGFAAGGATDISARHIAQKLGEAIGQAFVVENRPGAASTLASEFVAHSAPDGYTLLFANATVAMPSLFAKLNFDVRKDLAPVSLVGYGPLVMVIHPSIPARTSKELIALAKRRPGALNYGTAGVGSFTHLAMALYETTTGARMLHIPYKGTSQAMIGILTGEAHLTFSSVAAALPPVRQGKLRAIGVSGTRRSPVMPEVPTLAEGGVAGYDATSWYGLLAPAGTPRTAIARLGDEAVKALAAPESRDKLTHLGIEPARGGSDEFAPFLATEITKWAGVIKAAGIPPQ